MGVSSMIDYDAETNRYTITIIVGGEEAVMSFDRAVFLSSELEGLRYLLEGVQTTIDHAEMYSEVK